jgi:hypothetical protein
MLPVTARRLVPPAVRRAAAQMVAARRASAVERQLASIALRDRPILAGPFLGEVGFELLYWLPFLRWFVERVDISPDRLIAVPFAASTPVSLRSDAPRGGASGGGTPVHPSGAPRGG